MNSVVNLKDGFITFNSNIDHSLSFSKCAIGYSNYNINSHERGSLVFLTNNNANDTNISMNDIRMCIASDGNVGIGTNNPGYKLDIQGASAQTLRILDTRTTGDAIIALKEFNDNNGFDMAYIGATDDRFYIRGYNNSSTPRVDLAIDRMTSNVGIGMTNPKYKLDVAGTINASNILINGATVTANSLQWITSSSNVYTSNLSGNVGIGTNNPVNKLDVNGNINISTGNKFKINNVNLAFSDLGGSLSYNSLTDKPTLFDGNYNSLTNKLTGGTNIQILNGVINNTYTYTLPVATTDILGGVKIDGTSIVDVNGKITAVQVQADWNVTNTLSRAYILNKPIIPNNSQWTYSGTQIYYNGGNVGIGTSSTNGLLHLHKTATLQDVRIQLTDGTTTASANRGLHLIKSGTTGYLFNYENASLLFGTNGTERMTIDNVGNVGIGTNIPTSKLHIPTPDVATPFDLLDFRNTGNFGIYATSGSIGSRGNTLDFLARDYNNGSGIATRNVLTLRPEGNVGIGIRNATYKCHIKCSYGSEASGLHLDADDGSDNPNKYSLTIWPYVIAGGQVGWRFRTQNFSGGTHTPLTLLNNGSAYVAGSLSVGANIDSGSYIISTAGEVYARRGFDTLLYADGGQMSINFGNISSGATPSYLKLGAYGGHTFMESNASRNIYLRVWHGTFNGTLRQWEFNANAGAYNSINSSTWSQYSDHRIKENIVKANLKTCYDNVKNINLYRFNYIDSFQTGSADKNKLGYIAQEVKRHFPKATNRKKERLTDKREIPDLLTIDVEQINLTLYGAVKQLIKIVEKQDKRIKTLETLLNIEDNNDVQDDAGEAYERIYDEEECNIDDIEPTEPEQDKAPETTNVSNKV